ncbi:hypothetical protein ACFOU0_05820 [Salinicoccus sesuvii]|uniref:Uncharacterized protein n=2 Tax=Salinicoccus sesuvii TaxID=868281 RepID=A0ABV7N5D5_9STAP
MKRWERAEYSIQEVQAKRDLHEFNVIKNEEVIMTITPKNVAEMNETIRKLDENEPIYGI